MIVKRQSGFSHKLIPYHIPCLECSKGTFGRNMYKCWFGENCYGLKMLL